MSVLPPDIIPMLQYAAPPTVGAFIGYLTNKIAIKMLFRPLNPWRIFGFRVPMTPGVIPAKRHELAENMGNMVAEYLLTSEEVSHSLRKKDVKEQILSTIKAEGEKLADKDLGTIQSLLPEQFSCYYQHGVQYISSKLTDEIYDFVRSEGCANKVETFLEKKIEEILARKTSDLFAEGQQEKILSHLDSLVEEKIASFVDSEDLQIWLKKTINSGLHSTLIQGKTLEDIIPESGRDIFTKVVTNQSGVLLGGLGALLREDSVREKIIEGACGGVENFIASMGPMAAMVSNFVKMETVREKITEYLTDHDDDINEWMQSPEMTEKVTVLLTAQLDTIYKTPLVDLVKNVEPESIDALGESISEQIIAKLQQESLRTSFTELLMSRVKDQFTSGKDLGETLRDLIGEESVDSLVSSAQTKIVQSLQTPAIKEHIASLVDQILGKILSCKLGKLSRIFNENMRGSIYSSAQNSVITVLEREVPNLLQSFKLNRVVADKINSLDLLRLEQLLLSIMEEQFKYINLFGAILGFILGCINIIFLVLV